MPDEDMSLLDIRLSPNKSKIGTDLESDDEEKKEETEVSCKYWLKIKLTLIMQ